MRRRAFLALFAASGLSFVSVIANGQQRAPAGVPFRNQVQAYLDAWHAQAAFPGVSVGIVRNGTAMGFVAGVADRAAKTPMRETDLLLAGSTGKTFFAAVAVQLIDEGRLDLDPPISKYWVPDRGSDDCRTRRRSRGH